MVTVRKAQLIGGILAVVAVMSIPVVAQAQGRPPRTPIEDQPGYKREYVGTFETGYTVIETRKDIRTRKDVESSRPATQREAFQFRGAEIETEREAVRDQLAVLKAAMERRPSGSPEITELREAVIGLIMLVGE
jgi:hypothetical protein